MGMRVYWEVMLRSLRRQATYRGATFAGIFTNTVFAFFFAYVQIAVYRERSLVGTFTRQDALTMVFVSQGMLMVVHAFSERTISTRVASGDIATDLYRPIDFSFYWMADFLGRSATGLVLRGIPPFVVGVIAFHIAVPHQAATWLAFLVTALVAACVASRFWMLVNLTAFWLVDVRGIIQLGTAVFVVGSGIAIPLQYYPNAVQTVLRATPFAYMVQRPIELFLGKGSFGVVFAGQVLWFATLEIAVRRVMARATLRVVLQGG